MPYHKNPDMVALTIGRIVLDRVTLGKTASVEDILAELHMIVALGQKGRVSPQMAKGALAVLGAAEPTAMRPVMPRLTTAKLVAR